MTSLGFCAMLLKAVLFITPTLSPRHTYTHRHIHTGQHTCVDAVVTGSSMTRCQKLNRYSSGQCVRGPDVGRGCLLDVCISVCPLAFKQADCVSASWEANC
jgi:hypothetical protein